MTTIELLQQQVANEMYNHLVYLNMASAFDLMSLEGWSKHFFKHSEEERGHSLRLIEYLMARGLPSCIGVLPVVPSFDGNSPTAILEATAVLEKKTTTEIYAIAEAATKERDHQTYSMIQRFLDEQVQEEDEARKTLDLVRMNPMAAFLLNLEYLEA